MISVQSHPLDEKASLAFSACLRAILPLLAAGMVMLTACSINPSSSGGSEEAFRSGRASLECKLTCLVTWYNARNRLEALHDSSQWRDLAREVMLIGYRDDLSWYYLGRAAEGLGYGRAAQTYYTKSTNSSKRLGGRCKEKLLFYTCNGHIFPREAADGFKRVVDGGTYALRVKGTPSGATIKIMNIKPRFSQGIKLSSGMYRLRIQKPGYRTLNKKVYIRNSNLTVGYKLPRLRSPPVPPPTIDPPAHPPQTYALHVKVIPSSATIRITNIKRRFKQGIKLPPGSYSLTIEKSGYRTLKKTVNIKRSDRTVSYKLIPKTPRPPTEAGKNSGSKSDTSPKPLLKYSLSVTGNPSDATIKIMNISEKFRQGIQLPKGQYRLEISKSGYQTKNKTVTLSDRDVTVSFELVPVDKPKDKRTLGNYLIVIGGASVELKKSPDSYSTTIETLRPGAQLSKIKASGDWYKVRTQGGKEGYVYKEFVRPE